jgi:CRISPR-associated protein Csm1
MNAVLLGALLHDLGKVGQRAGFSGKCHEVFSTHLISLLPRSLEDAGKLASEAQALAILDSPESESARILQLACWISAGKKDQETESPAAPLISIFSRIDIGKGVFSNSAFYLPRSLKIDQNVIFPNDSIEEIDLVYKSTWQSLKDELALTQRIENVDAYTTTLLYLLKKHTWSVPFSHSQEDLDTSIFDHSKITCAISACLMKEEAKADEISSELLSADRGKERFLLVAGDVSGIQEFLYTITSKGAAKGLRGRSLYLQLLSEAAAKFMLRKLGYPLSNLIYCGGGHFYLLISTIDEMRLEDLKLELERALLQLHHGDIFLALGWSRIAICDFMDHKQALNTTQKSSNPQHPHSQFGLSAHWSWAMNFAGACKLQRFALLGSEAYEEIFGLNPNEKGGLAPVCDVCKREGGLWYRAEGGWYRWHAPNQEAAFCDYCKTFEKMGERLARAEYLIEVQEGCTDQKYDDNLLCGFEPFGIEYYYSRNIDDLNSIMKNFHDCTLTIYSLSPDNFINERLIKIASENNAALGFRLIASATPWKKIDAPEETNSKIENKKIADLNELAEDASGVSRIGILRMDVDNLGLVFSRGLKENASLSRISTLSTMLSIFFDGWIDRICLDEKWMNRVYLIYSGGDDLFIIGSWDVIPDIAIRIREDFRAYTCSNPNLSLSGGIAISEEKYPLYKSAESSRKALEDAKSRNNGLDKDAITFLKETLDWSEMEISHDIALFLSRCLKDGKAGENKESIKKLPRSVLWNLYAAWDLYWQRREIFEKNKMLTPKDLELLALYDRWRWRLVYFLDRAGGRNRAFEEDLAYLKTAILTNEWNGISGKRDLIEYLGIPTRWAELLTRTKAQGRQTPEMRTQGIVAPER